MLVDYNNSIVNLACSILKYFGAECEHRTLVHVDELLKNDYKNVVVLLLDGLGVDALQYHLSEDGFLRSNLIKEYSTVFPPTTTSATTSIESGLTPLEHGWLGWSLHFSEIDRVVDAFINTEKDTGNHVADYHVAREFVSYKSIYEKIKAAGIGNAYSVSKFGSNEISTFYELTDEIQRLCSTQEKKYIYGYWENPDSLMHKFGCYSSMVTQNIQELEDKIKEMCNGLSNTLVIVTADHGHCNLKHYVLSDYPKLSNMLKRPTSIETRATAFYVKEEYLKDFPGEFNYYFSDDFILYSKQEVIEKNIFGVGKMHPKFEEFIGDYLAVAISDKGIVYSKESKQFISNHAGMTQKEMKIPLIAISKS